MSGSGFAIATTTVESHDEARALAHALVEARLAACVQIAPITSVYRWQGKIEEAGEFALHCKIAIADFEEVRAAISSRHSYELPEIALLPITDGSVDYFDWLAAETRRA